MRNPRPFRWIEEAEARQVVTLALSETPPPPGLSHRVQAPSLWRVRLRRWSPSPAVAIAAEDTVPDALAKRSSR